MIDVLRRPRMQIYLVGRLVSILGSRGLWLVIGLAAHHETGRIGVIGEIGLSFLLGALAAPVAGLLVDRLRPRNAIIAGDVVAACATLTLVVTGPGMAGAGTGLGPVYLVMVLTGMCSSVTDPAHTALLQSIAPPERFSESAGATAVVDHSAALLAPLLGVVMAGATGLATVVVASASAFLIEALLFCVVPAGAVMFVAGARDPAAGRRAAVRRMWGELSAGVRMIRAAVLLRRLVVVTFLAMIALAMSQTVLFGIVDALPGVPEAFLGVLIAVQSGAAIATGVLMPRALRRWGAGPAAALASAAGACGYLLDLIGTAAAVVCGCALIGTASAGIAVAVTTAVLDSVPEGLVGRVESVNDLSVSLAQTAGFAAAAVSVDVIGHRLLICAGVALLVLGSSIVLGDVVRRPREPVSTDRAGGGP